MTPTRVACCGAVAVSVGLASFVAARDSDSTPTAPMGAAAAGPVAAPVTVETIRTDCAGAFPIEDTEDPATFAVDGVRIVMRGVYLDGTNEAVLAALDANPRVRTIVMANVGGADVSMDQNLDGARAIRARGLNTCVPENGLIASGGTDFFLGGVIRLVMNGGRVGVHSWAGGDENNEVVGSDVPRDDPQHAPFLAFYGEMGLFEDFYWFTLSAAAPDDMHYMTAAELQQHRVVTTEG